MFIQYNYYISRHVVSRHLIHQVASPSETASTPVAALLTQSKELNKESPLTPIHVTPALSKNAQYRKLRYEWKNNVRLAKSNIQVRYLHKYIKGS